MVLYLVEHGTGRPKSRTCTHLQLRHTLHRRTGVPVFKTWYWTGLAGCTEVYITLNGVLCCRYFSAHSGTYIYLHALPCHLLPSTLLLTFCSRRSFPRSHRFKLLLQIHNDSNGTSFYSHASDQRLHPHQHILHSLYEHPYAFTSQLGHAPARLHTGRKTRWDILCAGNRGVGGSNTASTARSAGSGAELSRPVERLPVRPAAIPEH